jgi:hypothetical protein
MSQRYELTPPQLDIKGPLETFRYKLPPVESIRGLIEANPDFMTGVLSSRRLTSIYGKTQSFTPEEIQEELELSTRNTYDISQIRAWNNTKEQVKFLFYDWSQSFEKRSDKLLNRSSDNIFVNDLAFDTVSRFIDLSWTGDERSIYHYLSRSAKFIIQRAATNSNVYFEGKVYHDVAVGLPQHKPISTLGYSGVSEMETAESIFKDIPLSDIPRIISLLPDSLTKYLCLQRLGYIDGDKSAEDLREVIPGIPVGYDIDRYRKSFLTQNVKRPLQEIIESKSYMQAPSVDFVGVLDSIEYPLKLYFYQDNQPVRYGSYQYKLLEYASGIDPSEFRYMLTPREQTIVSLLLETDIDGRVCYNTQTLASRLGLRSAFIPQYSARILHKLAGQGDIDNNPSQKYKDRAGYYNLFINRESITKRMDELNPDQRRVLDTIYDLYDKGEDVSQYLALSQIMEMRYANFKYLMHAIIKKMNEEESPIQ